MLQTIDLATDPWGIKVTRVELKNIRPPAAIREAEGRAEPIKKVQEANAAGIKAIKEAGADDAVIRLKTLDAFARAADGRAAKIIIPSDIASAASLATEITESLKVPKNA